MAQRPSTTRACYEVDGYNTWSLGALGYTPIPTAITLTDSGLIPHENEAIITDVDCRRRCSGAIIADHTTRDGWAPHKSSACTSSCLILRSSAAKVSYITSWNTHVHVILICKHTYASARKISNEKNRIGIDFPKRKIFTSSLHFMLFLPHEVMQVLSQSWDCTATMHDCTISLHILQNWRGLAV